ncbi:retrovirus-related pol polyprotein from transposon TNT 1-94 [Tanacetum coccineum]
MNQDLNENERLLEQVINKDIVNVIMNSSADIASVNVHECEKCLKIKTELQTDFIEKKIYDKMFKSFTTLEKHCISLEVDSQLNQEIFQRDNSISNQSAPSFDQLFTLNELKAQSQEKDTIIRKLKERIKSLSGKQNEDKIKKDLEDIETIYIELDHRVTKLIAENEHLKQTYKQLYDSIKPARNASLQKSFLVITALKDDLRKLKGKALVDNDVTKHPSDPEMLMIDVEPITLKLLNKQTAHSTYIKHTQKEAIVLRDLVEHVKSKYPLDQSLESACRYAKLVQELLTNISQTCPNVNNTDGKIVAVTPKNKDKRVRFIEPVTSSRNTITKTTSTSNQLLINLCLHCLADNHDLCVLDFIINVNARTKSKSVKKNSKRKVEKPTRKVFTNIGYIWRPTGLTFTIVGNACPLTRITTTAEVPLRKPTALDNETSKPIVTLVYSRKPRKSITNVPVSKSKVVQIVLWYLDSGCSKHMTGDRSQLTNFVNKFLGTVKFRNDHVAKILGYGDYQIGNVTISRVYYVEGLGHNLFSVGKFCDSNLEVAFRQHTCFIGNLEGVDLLTGSRGNNLYTLSLRDMMASFPICLLSKASKTKSWLWYRRLSHLNFGAINHLVRHSLVRGLPKLKFEKDHLCSACAMGKTRRNPTNLNLKTPTKRNFIFCTSSSLSMITLDSHGLMTVQRIRTNNGTEFVNQTLREYYEKIGISHETSVARSPQQNGVVERRNRTLIKAARTMLIYAKASLFLWAEAVATACYTQNRSIIQFGRIIETIHVYFDELTVMASEHSSSRPTLHEMTLATISSELMPNPPLLTPFVPPSRTDWDILFQLMFDELLTPPPSVDLPSPEVIAPIDEVVAPALAVATGSPSSTTVDQHAPSPSNDRTLTQWILPWWRKPNWMQDKEGKAVDPSHYHGMIGTLLYLTANADHAGCHDTRRSTSGSMQCLGDRPSYMVPQKGRRVLRYPVRKLNILLCRNVFEQKFQKISKYVKWLANISDRNRSSSKGKGFQKENLTLTKFILRHGLLYDHAKDSDSQTPSISEFTVDVGHEFAGSLYRIMSITKEQQQALDDALVLREQRLTIRSCNYRLSTTFKPKEPTFQVALDVLSLTPFYPAFLITVSVPTIYMQEFWATVTYQKHHIRFKMNKKSYSFDMDSFGNMLQMCPKLPGQEFVDPPFEEDILIFMRELGYSGNIKLLSDVKVDTLPQP